MHRLVLAVVMAALTLLGPAGALAARAPNTDSNKSLAVFDKKSAIVVFKDLSLASYDGRIRGYERTSPSKGKLNPNSAAAKKYLGYLKAKHSDYARWLQRNVPSAKITSDYFVSLNAVAVKLNGVAKGKLRNSDYVASVTYVTRYQKTMSESYKIINAAGAWTEQGSRANAGAGIKVGVIDSGIDASHPFFDPTGFSYPAGFPKCSGSNCDYVTPKVIVAKVFHNKLNQLGFDAEAIDSHGTHVAGTVAGVTGKTAVVEGVAIDDMSGVAPGAWLGNYNVFPGTVASARSEDILNAVEAAVMDGMDVLNLSLSGGYRGNNDLLAKGLDNAVAAGVVVAVSAGNNGPGPQTVGSPSRARNVITTGASTNDHFVGQPINYAGGLARGAVGDFDPLPAGTFDLVFLTGANANGCAAIPAVPSSDPTIIVLDRGACVFSQKVANAKAGGAEGVIVINNVAGDPTAMGASPGFDDDIGAVMISKADGAALRAANPAEVTVAATFAEFKTENEDILAGFSSQGPTFVDLNIKPDLTSVGVNVLSSVPCSYAEEGAGCGGEGTWAFFSGTSMSSPHIAGSAAVLLENHPSWSPARVKSALVNTADRVVTDAFDGAHLVGPRAQGAGRQDLTEASDSRVGFSPVAASFGKISGSQTRPTSLDVTLTNSTGSAMTFSIAEKRFNPSTFGIAGHTSAFDGGEVVTGDNRIDTPASITVPANGSVALRVTVRAGLPSQVIQGWLDLDGPNANDYTLAYMAFVP
ncbi:hypothetical protein BH23CHL6_BH23CHL6_09090 [soil metagenome]